ncbi:MAG: epimerase [Burkholderiaceae bacterium]
MDAKDPRTTAPAALVLGANGRFGGAAVQAFGAAGWRVLAQARRAPEQLPPGARHLGIDMADTARLAAAAQGVRAVVYAVNPPYTQWAAQALPLARQGMALAERLGATFMLPGNVYNFGAHMPAVLREDTPQRADTRKGRLRFEMEAELAARAALGLRSVVIRAGDFFGAGSGSWLDLVIAKDLRRGRLVYPGPLDVPHAWAYLPDLARAFVAAASHGALPAFARLHFAGHTLTGAELLAAIERAAESLGQRPARGWRHGSMPWGVIRIGGLVVPMWREIAEMAYLWRVPHALDGRAMRDALGPLPTTDLHVAMRQALIALGHADAAASAPAAAEV